MGNLIGFILWTIGIFVSGFLVGARNWKKKAELVAKLKGFDLKEELKKIKK